MNVCELAKLPYDIVVEKSTSAVFSHYPHIREKRKTHPMIVVISPPFSGGGILTDWLAETWGLERLPYHSNFPNAEQDLYLPALCKAHESRSLANVHMRAAYSNVEYMQVFGIIPLIVTRNIHHCILDLKLQLKDSVKKFNGSLSYPALSMAWYHQIDRLDSEKQMDFIIDMIVPWYIHFCASWQAMIRIGEINPLWITWESLSEQPAELFEKMNAHCHQTPLQNKNMKAMFDEVKNSLSVTQKNSVVSKEQLERMKGLTRFYPTVDFSVLSL